MPDNHLKINLKLDDSPYILLLADGKFFKIRYILNQRSSFSLPLVGTTLVAYSSFICDHQGNILKCRFNELRYRILNVFNKIGSKAFQDKYVVDLTDEPFPLELIEFHFEFIRQEPSLRKFLFDDFNND